jgi:succinoglycan biosynthesis transport protein ExoP
MLVEANRTEREPATPDRRELLEAVNASGINLLAAAWRQKFVVIGSTAAVLLLGLLYLLQAIPNYTSSSTLIIDSRKVGVTAISAIESALTFDSGVVDSQVQILQSDKLAGIVADRLGLADNQSFLLPARSPIGSAVSGVVSAVSYVITSISGGEAAPELADAPPAIRRLVAIETLKNNLKVTRVGRTYVLTIDYTDSDRQLARDIAAAYAQAYLADQIDSRVEIARNASVWLENRIRELRNKADAADRAAQTFRARNNLTEASGRLINEQSLTDSITQLSVARADSNAARAKYDRLKQIVDNRDYAASVVDSLANPLIQQLRTKYLQASKTNSDISAKVGPDHYQADAARKEMAEYSRLIFDELNRVLQTYQSEVQISADKVASLERSIERMKTVNTTDSEALTRLRSLEQEATTYNTLYTTMLQKFQETAQQQSYPVTDAAVLTEATIPLKPSSPKVLLVLAASIVLGGLVGCAIAAWREFRDAGFRTSAQVREWLGLDFIAYVPKVAKRAFHERRAPRAPHSHSDRTIPARKDSLDYVTTNSLSRYAEALRTLKVSLDVRTNLRRPVVVGFVSVLPDEGKSTTAKNFASLVASQGERVLLIDGDLRNPHLTRALTPSARGGVVDLLRKTVQFDELVFTEVETSLAFLPGATHKRFDASGDLLGSQAMAEIIRTASGRYDVVVLDLPPAGVLVDATAAASSIDYYYLVVEWGRTRRDTVRDLLLADPVLADKTIGVVLTKVNMDKLKAFGAYGAYGYGGSGGYSARYYGHHKG